MAAIIDWHSKAVLSHRISNTMDSQLVMSVLNDALEKHHTQRYLIPIKALNIPVRYTLSV
ncbi:hypothetical protein BSPWISOXPB_6481 [uncultured Gammaproteobacteria bacterium]|nr:hypothetical protein BSPWISOXPB_6481 [uncultured Gammaproteobacteria bacterium]